MHYHKFNTYSQLRTIVLGSYFPAEYFDFIDDVEIRNSLMKIAKEINEDLDYYQQVLENHKVKVLRPTLPSKKEFIDNELVEPGFNFISFENNDVMGHCVLFATTLPIFSNRMDFYNLALKEFDV